MSRIFIFLGAFLFPHYWSLCQQSLALNDSIISTFKMDGHLRVYGDELRVAFVNNYPYVIHPNTREIIPFTSDTPLLPTPEKYFGRPDTAYLGGRSVQSPILNQSRIIKFIFMDGDNIHIVTNRAFAFDAHGNELKGRKKISPGYINYGWNFPSPENLYGNVKIDRETGVVAVSARDYWVEEKALSSGERKNWDRIPLISVYQLKENSKSGHLQIGSKIGVIEGIDDQFSAYEAHLTETYFDMDGPSQSILMGYVGAPEIFIYNLEGNLKKKIVPLIADDHSPIAIKKGSPSSSAVGSYNFQPTFGRVFVDPHDPQMVYRVYRPAWKKENFDAVDRNWVYDFKRWKPSQLMHIDRETGATEYYDIPKGHYVIDLRENGLYTRKMGDFERPILYRFALPGQPLTEK